MEKEYVITRPPLTETFELSEREDLLGVSPGDLVKLIFNGKERMWVEVLHCCYPWKWAGAIKNDPVTEECAALTYETSVEFHPLDIINIIPFDERSDLGDNSAYEWES